MNVTKIRTSVARLILASVTSAVLLAACGATAETPAPPAIPGAPEVAVSTTEMRFTPSDIRLPADAVNLLVRNDGSQRHDLTIAELGIKLVVEPGQSVTAGLRDLKPGTYEFHCSVFGHKDGGMVGRVTVE